MEATAEIQSSTDDAKRQTRIARIKAFAQSLRDRRRAKRLSSASFIALLPHRSRRALEINPRREVRGDLFQKAFQRMPLWETWSTVTKCDSGFRDTDGERILIDVKRNHCKSISRQLRRSMARDLAHRQWEAR